MPLPNPLRFLHRTFPIYMADLGTAGSAYFTAPTRGRVVGVSFTPYAVVTGTSNVSVKINGVAITGMIAAITGAAGASFTLADPTVSSLANFQQGDVIELATDGASTTVSPGTWVVVTREF